MKKYWFKHHGQASSDPRMRLLKKELGYAGVGVFWEIMECIEMWGGGRYPRKGIYIIVRSRRVTHRMIDRILDEFFLFECDGYDYIRVSDLAVGDCDVDEFEEMMKHAPNLHHEDVCISPDSNVKGGREITEIMSDCGHKMTEITPNSGHEMTEIVVPQGARVENRLDENRLEVDDDMRVACEKDPLCPTGISPVKGEKAGAMREDPLCPTGISPVKGEKAGAVCGAEEAWLRFVEPLREEQTGWQDVVCMKSGYGALLRRRWQEAIEEFVRHVVEHDQGHTIQNAHDARYYFASYARLSVRSGQKLRDCLQANEDAEAEERKESDPYRYELRVDGVRYASGRPIPPEAPPRPTATAVWNDATGSWSESI